MDGAEDAPGLRKAGVVAQELEDGDCGGGDAGGPLRPVGRRLGVELDEDKHERGVGAEPVVAGLVGGADRLPEHLAGLGELADVHQRLAQVGEQVEPVLVEGRKERRRAPEQVRGGRHVAAGERPVAGRSQPLGRLPADGSAAVVERAELGEIGVRLLEVVAEDLLVLARAVAVHLVGPRHEALVELSPMPLQEAGVGGVADQDVLERVRRAGGHDLGVRLDEPAPLKAAQVLGDGRPARLGHELDDGRLGEHQAHHRRRANDVALAPVEPVEPGREESVNRRWYGDVAARRVLDHRQHLLEEERVPACGLDDRPERCGRHRAPGQAGCELRRLVGREPVELDGGAARLRGPAVAVVRELVAGRAEEQERRRRGGEVVDQFEHRRLGPVQVLERDDEWPALGDAREHPAEAEEELVDRSTPRR